MRGSECQEREDWNSPVIREDDKRREKLRAKATDASMV